MSKLSEQVFYLRGLCNGLDFDGTTKEGRVLLAVINALDVAAAEAQEMRQEIEDVSGLVDDVSMDVLKLMDNRHADEDEEADTTGYLELSCPKCHQKVYIERETFDITQGQTCPLCGTPLFDAGEDETDDE